MTMPAPIACAALLLATALPALADEAQDAFDQLYGGDVKRVQATPSPADDLALAKQLLEAAGKAEKQPAFLALLCEKAYELAAKDASGYPTATATMNLLAEKVPEKKIECLQKCAALYQRQYATARGEAKTKAGEALIEALRAVAQAQADADDADAAGATLRQAITVATAIRSDAKAALQAQLAALVPARQLEKQIESLKAKLEANPKDEAARKELVRLCLVEMDDPAEAAKFIDESLDDATRKYVPGAAKPLEDAPELACKELGDWYKGLADQAQAPASKGAMFRRAQAYYQRFLDLHTAEDLARTTVSLLLKKVEDALAKLPAPKVAAGVWVDCLKLVDPAKDTVKGRWELKDAILHCAGREPFSRLAFPIPLDRGYEAHVTFARTSGDEAIYLLLPAGKGAFDVVLSAYHGKLHGLEFINGREALENGVCVTPGPLVNGQDYTLEVKVRLLADDVEIESTLNGRPLLRWKGAQAALTRQTGVLSLPDPRWLGVGTYTNEAVFRRVRVRALSGELKKPQAAAKLTTAWTDCLKLVDPARDAVKGKWELRNGQLFSTERGQGCRLSLPVVPQQSYEVQVTLTRTAGNDALALCLPAGKGVCALVLSTSRGAWHRLEIIDGKGELLDGKPELVRPGMLVNGQEYVLGVKVFLRGDDAEIAATLDGRPLLQWKGRQASLSTHPVWTLPDPRHLGVGTWKSEAVFKGIRVRALPDDARTAPVKAKG